MLERAAQFLEPDLLEGWKIKMPYFRNQAGELSPFKHLHYQIFLVQLPFLSKSGEKENYFKEHQKVLSMAFFAFFFIYQVFAGAICCRISSVVDL